jgi:hypothetical protein
MAVFNNILSILNDFEPIGLNELNQKAALTSRVDKKYVIWPFQLPAILQHLKLTHQILQINNQRVSNYRSIYFDTPDLSLYHAHHNGVAARVKLRVRDYLDSNIQFFEIKNRTNKGLTSKRRTQFTESNLLNENLENAKNEFSRFINNKPITESLKINYQRITLVSKTSVERITIDGNLNFNHGDAVASYDDRIIIEVKTEQLTHSSTDKLLKKLNIRDGSVSKYCLGITKLHPSIKKNYFKNDLHIIESQLNKYVSTASN